MALGVVDPEPAVARRPFATPMLPNIARACLREGLGGRGGVGDQQSLAADALAVPRALVRGFGDHLRQAASGNLRCISACMIIEPGKGGVVRGVRGLVARAAADVIWRWAGSDLDDNRAAESC